MKNPITVTMLAIGAMLAFVVPAPAQTQQQHDAHHPDAQTTSPQTAKPGQKPSTKAPPGAQGMQGGSMPMMGMMAMMMNMMKQGSLSMAEMAMPGMDMADAVEGRIAFLKTELKITAAQEDAWKGFAEALQANAKALGGMRDMMMQQAGAEPSLAARLDRQERWYAARLDGIRALKSAFTPLYAALSDEQKQTADRLAPPHLGLMPMGMMPMGMMAMGGSMPMRQMPQAKP
jgi:hypothetical protein